MVKYHRDSQRGNPNATDRIAHTTTFIIPAHWFYHEESI